MASRQYGLNIPWDQSQGEYMAVATPVRVVLHPASQGTLVVTGLQLQLTSIS